MLLCSRSTFFAKDNPFSTFYTKRAQIQYILYINQQTMQIPVIIPTTQVQHKIIGMNTECVMFFVFYVLQILVLIPTFPHLHKK